MVKGISRRVVVVKAPIGSIFDEAIFIMRDDAVSAPDVDSEKILREACAAADEYVRTHCRQKRNLRCNLVLLSALAAAAIASLITFLFVVF